MTDGRLPPSLGWNWLGDTYWYVPPESLPAMRLNAGELAWMEDQTVWHLTGCEHGYVWGVCATLLRPAGEEPSPVPRPATFTVLGSVTPQGSVNLAFIPQGEASSNPPTIGVGRMMPHRTGWSFEMQMASGTDVVTSHWAYMAMVSRSDPAWHSLPGPGVSVPTMLAGCEYPQPPAPVA